MKKYDIVKLKKLKREYESRNLYMAKEGEVLSVSGDMAEVLFFNEYNRGDYAVVTIPCVDLEVVRVEHSRKYLELTDAVYNEINKEKHQSLNSKKFDEVDCVEVVVDSPKYSRYGILRGMRGIVASDYAIKGEVLVDFGEASKKLFDESMGLLSVNLEDLKKVER